MFKPIQPPQIVVLGLSLDLYRQTMPGFMDKMGALLNKFTTRMKPFATLVATRLCYTQAQVTEGIKLAERREVDALVLVPMSYTASLMTLLPIMRTMLPVVIWNTQETREVKASFNFEDLKMNHNAQGTQDVTNVLVRQGKIFGMESGHYEDAQALKRLGEWFRAAQTAGYARSIRVGLLGHPFQDMGDFGVDETAMAAAWGPQQVYLSIPRFVELTKSASSKSINDIISSDKKTYDISPGVTRNIHAMSARLELGLRQLVEENSLDALTMNFKNLVDDGRCATIPFLGINKMLAEGLGYAGEGNSTLAAHMAQMRQLAGRANFTEIYTIDYAHNRLLMDHMQECNPAMARKDRKVKLVQVDFWVPGMHPYVGMHFTLEPGPVTLTNITTDADGKFYYIAYETEIYDTVPLKAFTIPHWLVQLREPAGDFLTRYSYAGGTHHLTAVPGHCASLLKKLAYFQGFKFVHI